MNDIDASTLRERQKAATRDQIVDAAIDMIAAGEFDRATHDGLAERVGASRRTVYRYFPSRDALIEAVWERVNQNPRGAVFGLPTDVESVVATAGEWFEMAEANRKALTIGMTTPQGRGLRAQFRAERAAAWRTALAPLVEGLPEGERDLPLAVLQLLRSGFAWLEMHDQWNLGPDEMAKAVRWASRLLIADLEARGGRGLEE